MPRIRAYKTQWLVYHVTMSVALCSNPAMCKSFHCISTLKVQFEHNEFYYIYDFRVEKYKSTSQRPWAPLSPWNMLCNTTAHNMQVKMECSPDNVAVSPLTIWMVEMECSPADIVIQGVSSLTGWMAEMDWALPGIAYCLGCKSAFQAGWGKMGCSTTILSHP